MTITVGGQNYYYFQKDSCEVYSTNYNKAYDFWNDPREDIYTLEDGEPIGGNNVHKV